MIHHVQTLLTYLPTYTCYRSCGCYVVTPTLSVCKKPFAARASSTWSLNTWRRTSWRSWSSRCVIPVYLDTDIHTYDWIIILHTYIPTYSRQGWIRSMSGDTFFNYVR